jgi:hypothetical protein
VWGVSAQPLCSYRGVINLLGNRAIATAVGETMNRKWCIVVVVHYGWWFIVDDGSLGMAAYRLVVGSPVDMPRTKAFTTIKLQMPHTPNIKLRNKTKHNKTQHSRPRWSPS